MHVCLEYLLISFIFMLIGQSQADIVIEIRPDNVPETDEELMVTLTRAEPAETQKLRAGATAVKIVIVENDNPGGIFQFSQSMKTHYTMQV